ncbi:MAG TPA: hypothetical protein VK642_10270 [Burkholderiales bacterium]|nr:hypothetical protein [Burkholderiales bacterium]
MNMKDISVVAVVLMQPPHVQQNPLSEKRNGKLRSAHAPPRVIGC